MIITAIISAILSYIIIGAVLLLDLTICGKFTNTSEISTKDTGTGCMEGTALIVHEHPSLQTAA